MKDGNVKQILLRVGPRGRRRVNGQGEGGRIWSMHFISLHEDRMMKPVEIILSRERRRGRTMVG
jgi:hypothetical protein